MSFRTKKPTARPPMTYKTGWLATLAVSVALVAVALADESPPKAKRDYRAAMRQFPGFAAARLDDRAMAVAEAVSTAAGGLGVSATEVALAWVRDRPGVTAPIVGSRTVPQLRTALASEDLELPPEIVAALDEVSD